MPPEERPRERLLKYGAGSLSNTELLAIILQKGTKDKDVLDLSKEILSEYNLSRLSVEDASVLKKINGIGSAKSCQLLACFELGRRLARSGSTILPILNSPEEVYKLLLPKVKGQKKEHLFGLYLDIRKRLLREEIVSLGTLDSSVLHPREIFRPAIKESAAAVIIAHNHPSGNSSPSQEDLDITKQIHKAGELIGIPLLDHIIIGEEGYTSLRSYKEIFS